LANDELLDFCDGRGEWGGVATRREVHARGLWHRTLHLWLATPDEGGSLLYQLRSATTANWPNRLDASVAGHLLAGETFADAMRESREEIGITVPSAAAILLGIRREEHPDPAGGWNRELQGIHIARLDPAWGHFDAVDHEAAGLIRIGHDAGLRLHCGEVARIECDALLAGETGVRETRHTITLDDFVPRDAYYRRMHAIAARLIAGESAASLAGAYDRED
jgi:isopentenyldiphosphate isomerase